MPSAPVTVAAVSLALLGSTASAQMGGTPPQPPAEAYSACAGRRAGDLVSFTAHGHTIEGTCEKIGDRLALRPSQPPPGRGGARNGSGPAADADTAAPTSE